MAFIAEIYTDHPTQTTTDQIEKLYVAKTINAADYRFLVTTIAEQQAALDHPRTASVPMLLADGRQINVCKYQPPDGFAEGQRVRVAKKPYANAGEEFAALVAEHQVQHRSTEAQAINAIAATHPGLWDAYAQDQRHGRNTGRRLSPTAPVAPTAKSILEEATTLVAKSAGMTTVEALAQLVQQHGGQREYLDVYRQYVTTQGYVDHDAGQVAKSQVAPRTVYDSLASPGR
jgi:hypothetical protein